MGGRAQAKGGETHGTATAITMFPACTEHARRSVQREVTTLTCPALHFLKRLEPGSWAVDLDNQDANFTFGSRHLCTQNVCLCVLGGDQEGDQVAARINEAIQNPTTCRPLRQTDRAG